MRSAARALPAVLVLIAFAGPAPGADAASALGVSLNPVGRTTAGGLAVARGRVRAGGGAAVEVQRRQGRRWVVVVRGHASRAGRYALTFTAPRRTGSIRLRAVVRHRGRRAASPTRSLRVRKAPSVGAAPVVRAVVVDASTVIDAPAPGKSGTLSYSGGIDIRKGQIIAIGVGDETPYGFLGRVVSIRREGTRTIARTEPASLLDAIPTGTLNAVLRAEQPSGSARAAAAFSWQCVGQANASLTATSSFGTSLTFNASWSIFSGLRSASLVAGAHANATLAASANGKGRCSVKGTLASFNGPTATFFVGPVPIVLSSKVTIGVAGSAGICASVSSSVSASLNGSAGVGWTAAGGFHPIGGLNASMNFQPPNPSANAHVGADVLPKLSLLLYGAVGPEVTLKAGLSFDADLNAWALTAPVSLSAKLSIPVLSLSSPSFDIYKQTFPLAGGQLLPPPEVYPVPCKP